MTILWKSTGSAKSYALG